MAADTNRQWMHNNTKSGFKMLLTQHGSLLKAFLIGLFMFAFLLKAFLPLAFLPTGMAFIAALLFSISFKDLKPLNRNMISVLLACSGVLIWSGQGPFSWSQAVIENAGIVTLLLTAPLLGAILHYAPYDVALIAFANRYIRTEYMFYVLTLTLSAFFCSLMSLAAIPFTNQLVAPVAAKYPAGILHRALTRGFAVNLFWSPNLISVAAVLQYVHVPWQKLAPVGMAFSVLAFIAACIVEKYEQPGSERLPAESADTAVHPAVQDNPDSKRYIVLLIIQVMLILAALVAFVHYTGKSIYVTMAVIAVTIPLLIAMVTGKIAIYKQRLWVYFHDTLPNMCNEFVLFISIGFFGYALAKSPAITVVQAQLAAISGYSPSILVLLIIGTIAGLAMTGIHPIIAISSLAIALGKVDIGLSEVQLAISLITGYIMYLLLSPFSSVVMMMTGLSGRSVYEMGLKMNNRYALALMFLVVFTIHIWRQV